MRDFFLHRINASFTKPVLTHPTDKRLCTSQENKQTRVRKHQLPSWVFPAQNCSQMLQVFNPASPAISFQTTVYFLFYLFFFPRSFVSDISQNSPCGSKQHSTKVDCPHFSANGRNSTKSLNLLRLQAKRSLINSQNKQTNKQTNTQICRFWVTVNCLHAIWTNAAWCSHEITCTFWKGRLVWQHDE